jgi:hydroxyacylglutathione hydrolase
MVLVKTFYAHNELRNFSYLLLDQESGSSWVIDPFEAAPMIDYIKKNGLVLRGILNTHQHFDHIRGNAPLQEAFHAPVLQLEEGEQIHLNQKFSLDVLNTPGHTMDHRVFLWKESHRPRALFSGDTLFNSGVGNCKNGGDVNLLFETTMRLLRELPEETLLYPGHDYRQRNLEFASSVEPENKRIQERLCELKDTKTEELPAVNLKEEKEVNPFFRLGSSEIKERIFRKNSQDSSPETERELFIQLRKLRDNW